jgi:hypothetical protein
MAAPATAGNSCIFRLNGQSLNIGILDRERARASAPVS